MLPDQSIVPFLTWAAVAFAVVVTVLTFIVGQTDGVWTGAGVGLGLWMAALYATLKGV